MLTKSKNLRSQTSMSIIYFRGQTVRVESRSRSISGSQRSLQHVSLERLLLLLSAALSLWVP